MNKDESTEMINNKFLTAKTIEDASKLDVECSSGGDSIQDAIKRLCKLHKKPMGVLIDELTIAPSTFYNRLENESQITKGFIVEIAFTIGGVTLAELSELLKIANVGQLDAKRNREDRYVLMFFGRNIDAKEYNKSKYDIWELEQLLREKVRYKDRKIIFSVTEKNYE